DVTYGTAATATLVNPFDPSSEDVAAGFRYAFSIGTDTTGAATYAMSGTSSSVDFGVLDAGTCTVYARIFDKDGDSTPYHEQLTVAKATPEFFVGLSGGTYNGSPFTATTLVGGVGHPFATTLEGVGLTIDYFNVDTRKHLGSTAPTEAGNYRQTASFA